MARLVTKILSRSHRSRSSATSGPALSNCSKLSSTSNSCSWRTRSCKHSSNERLARSRTPSAWAMVESARPGSRSGERSTNHTPPANSSRRAPAVAMASRVLPIPGAPVKVSRRTSSRNNRWRTASHVDSRPTSGVAGRGRLCAEALPAGFGRFEREDPPSILNQRHTTFRKFAHTTARQKQVLGSPPTRRPG
jgi:hypothetical protein